MPWLKMVIHSFLWVLIICSCLKEAVKCHLLKKTEPLIKEFWLDIDRIYHRIRLRKRWQNCKSRHFWRSDYFDAFHPSFWLGHFPETTLITFADKVPRQLDGVNVALLLHLDFSSTFLIIQHVILLVDTATKTRSSYGHLNQMQLHKRMRIKPMQRVLSCQCSYTLGKS